MNLIPMRWRRRESTAGPMDLFGPGMGQLFEGLFKDLRAGEGEGSFLPRLDASETEKEIELQLDLPGVSPEDVEVTLSEGRLTITGEKKVEREDDERAYHRLERSYGSFSRSVDFGERVDPDKVAASFKDGVLTVTLAKAEASKPRKIDVKSN